MTDITILVTAPWVIVAVAVAVAYAVTRPRQIELPRAWVVRR